MILVRFQGKLLNIAVIQVYAPSTDAEETEDEQFDEDLQHILQLTPKKDVFFIIGDWLKCKSRKSKDIQSKFGITSKFGLGVQNEAGQRLRGFCQENMLSIESTFSKNPRDNSTHGHL